MLAANPGSRDTTTLEPQYKGRERKGACHSIPVRPALAFLSVRLPTPPRKRCNSRVRWTRKPYCHDTVASTDGFTIRRIALPGIDLRYLAGVRLGARACHGGIGGRFSRPRPPAAPSPMGVTPSEIRAIKSWIHDVAVENGPTVNQRLTRPKSPESRENTG